MSTRLTIGTKLHQTRSHGLRESLLLALGFALFVALPVLTLSPVARAELTAVVRAFPPAASGPAHAACRYDAAPVRDRFGAIVGWQRAPAC